MAHWLRNRSIRLIAPALVLTVLAFASSRCQEVDWVPNMGTHAWARFGPRAWKEVRILASGFDENERVVRTSTTIARTRVTRVARHSIGLCVSTTVEVAGREFSPEPQEITRDLAPAVESSKIIDNDTVVIRGVSYPTQVIELVTKRGAKRDVSHLYHCSNTVPPVLKRITTSVDIESPDVNTTTTVAVTGLNEQRDILGEAKCTWSVTTVVEAAQRTITIREVHCEDVPGELVSQVTEERNAEGKLVSRKELELVGYGHGRLRRITRRR